MTSGPSSDAPARLRVLPMAGDPWASVRVLAPLGVFIVCLHHWLPPAITHGVLRGAYGAELLFFLTGLFVTRIALRARRATDEQLVGPARALARSYAHAFLVPALCYFAVVGAIVLATGADARTRVALLTLTYNVHAAVSGELKGTLAHMWAPSIAFQFALVWIPLLLFTPRRLRLPFCAVAVAAGPLSRLALELAGAPQVWIRCGGVTSLDALGGGALLTVLLERVGATALVRSRATRACLWIGLPLVAWGMALQYDQAQVERSTWQMLVMTTKAPFFFWLVAQGLAGFPRLASLGRRSHGPAVHWLARASFAAYLFHAFAPPVVRAGLGRLGIDVPLLPVGFALFTAFTFGLGLVAAVLLARFAGRLLERHPLAGPLAPVPERRAA